MRIRGNENLYIITGGDGNVFIYYYGNGMKMGIRSCEKKGMGSKRPFPHISTNTYNQIVLESEFFTLKISKNSKQNFNLTSFIFTICTQHHTQNYTMNFMLKYHFVKQTIIHHRTLLNCHF